MPHSLTIEGIRFLATTIFFSLKNSRSSISKTEYSINGTKATYYQDDDLTKEMTLSVNINYEKKFYKFGKILISIDGKSTTQEVNSIGANISFIKAL